MQAYADGTAQCIPSSPSGSRPSPATKYTLVAFLKPCFIINGTTKSVTLLAHPSPKILIGNPKNYFRNGYMIFETSYTTMLL